jgi:hypothetical protein
MEDPMTAKHLARVLRLVGFLAVAAAIAVVGRIVPVTAAGHDTKVQVQHKAKQHQVPKKRPAPKKHHPTKVRHEDKEHHDGREHHENDVQKVAMCHAAGNGRFELVSISAKTEAAHRAHGDARPGEQVPRNANLLFDAQCRQVPRQVEAAPLTCTCWKGYTQPTLVSALTGVSGEPWCSNTPDTVSLSPDQGTTTLVYASTSGACILRLNGEDLASTFSLTAAEATQCVVEAAAFVPDLKWCPQ